MLEKPSGLLSVPGRGSDKLDCLETRAKAVWPETRHIHRLDRDTSGLIVFARDSETHRQLSGQFERREVAKEYLALVAGQMPAEQGTVAAPLVKDFDHPPRHKIDFEQGRAATTDWRVVERGADRTRVALVPLTGRSHQLRIHLAHLGHPILGDPLYAPPEVQALAPRLLLHAAKLAFLHPSFGEPLTFESYPDF